MDSHIARVDEGDTESDFEGEEANVLQITGGKGRGKRQKHSVLQKHIQRHDDNSAPTFWGWTMEDSGDASVATSNCFNPIPRASTPSNITPSTLNYAFTN